MQLLFWSITFPIHVLIELQSSGASHTSTWLAAPELLWFLFFYHNYYNGKLSYDANFPRKMSSRVLDSTKSALARLDLEPLLDGKSTNICTNKKIPAII